MKQIRKSIFIIPIVVVIVACNVFSPVSNNLETSVPVGTETQIVSTIKPILPTKSAIPTASPTDSAKSCPDSQQKLPVDIKGEFVLSKTYILYRPALEAHTGPAYILIPSTGDTIELPSSTKDEMSDFSISPDKTKLAYYAQQSGNDGRWFIVGNNGKLFKFFSGKQYPASNWLSVLEWLDNNRLLISKFTHQNPYSSFVFNPFTDKTEQELLPDYSDIFIGYSGELSTWEKYGLPETVYSPDLSMVVYPKNPNTIILWDIKAKNQIAELVDKSASSHAPLWLSNGKEFLIDVTAQNTTDQWYQDELISVGVDGKIRQLTDLANSNYVNVAIQNYSESSDERYIAFWFAQVNSGPSRLAVYDTLAETTKVFCTIVGGYIPPIWSPSEHQLLVDGKFDNLDNYGTIFVDVESSLLAEVEKGVVPGGWMVAP